MRYMIVDDHRIDVKCCDECPFYKITNHAGCCKYPVNPASKGRGVCMVNSYRSVQSDCPLRISEAE